MQAKAVAIASHAQPWTALTGQGQPCPLQTSKALAIGQGANLQVKVPATGQGFGWKVKKLV